MSGEGFGLPLFFWRENEMMKIYKVGQFTRQYEEGTQPEGAVEVKKKTPATKAAKKTNKSKKAENK